MLLLALALGFYLVRTEPKPNAPKVSEGLRLMPEIAVEAIDGVDWTVGRERLQIVATRDGPDAQVQRRIKLTTPSGRADESHVDRLFFGLTNAKALRWVNEAEVPRSEARLEGEITVAGSRIPIALLGPAPYPEGASYLRIQGKLAVIGRDLTQDLLSPPDFYRDSQLNPYAAAAAVRIERVKDGAEPEQVALRTRNVFVFSSGPKKDRRVARAPVERLLTVLADLRFERFLPYDLSEKAPGFQKSIRIEFQKSEHLTLRIEKPCAAPEGTSQVLVLEGSSDPVRACVPTRLIEEMFALNFAEETSIALMRADEVTELGFRHVLSGAAEERFDIGRKERGFRLQSPESRDLEPDEAVNLERYLGRVLSTTGTLMQTTEAEARNGGWQSNGALTFRSDGSEEALDFYRDADHVFVFRRADQTWLRLEQTNGKLVLPNAKVYRGSKQSFWPPAYWAKQAEGESAIQIRCPQPLRLERSADADGHLEVFGLGAASARADATRASELIGLLDKLEVQGWLTADATSEAKKNQCNIDAGSAHIVFGATVGDSVVADVQSDAMQPPSKSHVLVPKRLVELLQGNFVERKPWAGAKLVGVDFQGKLLSTDLELAEWGALQAEEALLVRPKSGGAKLTFSAKLEAQDGKSVTLKATVSHASADEDLLELSDRKTVYRFRPESAPWRDLKLQQ
jgi:hypothetical protein